MLKILLLYVLSYAICIVLGTSTTMLLAAAFEYVGVPWGLFVYPFASFWLSLGFFVLFMRFFSAHIDDL